MENVYKEIYIKWINYRENKDCLNVTTQKETEFILSTITLTFSGAQILIRCKSFIQETHYQVVRQTLST